MTARAFKWILTQKTRFGIYQAVKWLTRLPISALVTALAMWGGLNGQTVVAGTDDATQAAPTQVEEFLRTFLSAERERSVTKAIEYYAERVEFYDHGQVSKNFIRDNKAAQYSRWPTANIERVGKTQITTVVPGSEWVAFETIKFRFESVQRGEWVSGLSENVYHIAVVDGVQRITREHGTVSDRKEGRLTAEKRSAQPEQKVVPSSLSAKPTKGQWRLVIRDVKVKDVDVFTSTLTVSNGRFELERLSESFLKPGAPGWTVPELRNVRECGSKTSYSGPVVFANENELRVRIEDVQFTSIYPKGWFQLTEQSKRTERRRIGKEWTFLYRNGNLIDQRNPATVLRRTQ